MKEVILGPKKRKRKERNIVRRVYGLHKSNEDGG